MNPATFIENFVFYYMITLVKCKKVPRRLLQAGRPILLGLRSQDRAHVIYEIPSLRRICLGFCELPLSTEP